MEMMAIDPFALEIAREVTAEYDIESSKANATWEHQDLAQVRIRVLRGHTDCVSSCQFIADDTRILTASHDKSVMVWDSESGTSLQTLHGHEKCITKARATQDARRVVTSGWDKKLHVWDLETGQILWTGEHNGIVTSCNFSCDGQLLISGSDLDHTVKVWNAETGEMLLGKSDLHSSTITSCQFSPSGERLMTTSMDRTTKIWDRHSLTTTISLGGHANVISCASMTNDERKAATVSWDKSIAIWDVSTGMYRSQGPGKIEKAHEGSISSCQFSEDGMLLVTGGYDHTVALWDAENMVQKLRLQGHTDWVTDACYSADMKWLLSCSKDKTVRLWNIEDSDKIPVVLENRKSVGLKVSTCALCGKPFSIEGGRDSNTCVFCRLQTPEQTPPAIESQAEY